MHVFDVISKLISISINLFDVTFKDTNIVIILSSLLHDFMDPPCTVQSDHEMRHVVHTRDNNIYIIYSPTILFDFNSI